MDYRKDVREDALDFIRDHEDMFLQALQDDHAHLHDFDIDYSGEFHESVVDRSYTLADAAYILDNCSNEETDRGLWEGMDPKDAVPVMAAYSYAADVREELAELYEDLYDKYTDELNDLNEEKEQLEDDQTHGGLEEAQAARLKELDDVEDLAAKSALSMFMASHKPHPPEVAPKSDEERQLLQRWLYANSKVGLRGGYPLGSSYIDSRCGTGHGMPDEKDYVDLDHEVAARCPHMRGSSRAQVESYIKKHWKKDGSPKGGSSH